MAGRIMNRLPLTLGALVVTVAGSGVAALGPTAEDAVAEMNTLTAAEKAAGWTLLFDGTSTDAWRGYRMESFPAEGWAAEDGTLKVTGGNGGDIMTVDQYENFELSMEWKVLKGGNSGIMYRVTQEYGASWQSGPEYQFLDDKSWNVTNTAGNSAGALYDLYPPSDKKVLHPAGEFNHARIRMLNGRVTHWLNGVRLLEADLESEEWAKRVAASKFSAYPNFGKAKRGHIALQDHGNDLWFRNIKIRDLDQPMPGEKTLFNGRDLAGWTVYNRDGGSAAEAWRIEDGLLLCAGRPIGYVRTTDDHTNYVIRLEWRFNPVTKESGNSGVLIRMIGEDKVWPRSVEAQLHGGNAGDFWNIGNFEMSVDPDRTNGRNTKKTHFAERPIGEWNDYEIIVDGGDVILIVNGDEVNRAWDVAEVAGKICLQSEGAEIHFRNIRLAPIK